MYLYTNRCTSTLSRLIRRPLAGHQVCESLLEPSPFPSLVRGSNGAANLPKPPKTSLNLPKPPKTPPQLRMVTTPPGAPWEPPRAGNLLSFVGF